MRHSLPLYKNIIETRSKCNLLFWESILNTEDKSHLRTLLHSLNLEHNMHIDESNQSLEVYDI